MEQELIGVPELALIMGRSESAIRTAMGRDTDWLPPHIKQGRRIFWRLETVRSFNREYEEGKHRKAKAGRPRLLPQLVSQRVG